MSEKRKQLPRPNQDELFRFHRQRRHRLRKDHRPRYSYWKSVFRVFFRKKINIFMLALLVLIFLASFIMPIFWPYDPMENVTDASTFNLSPSARP